MRSTKLFILFLIFFGIFCLNLQPFKSHVWALAPRHQQIDPEKLGRLGGVSLDIALALAEKLQDDKMFGRVASTKEQWQYLIQTVGTERFLGWMRAWPQEQIYGVLTAMPYLRAMTTTRDETVRAVEVLLKMRERGFPAAQLEDWAWVVSAQAPLAQRLGLDYFADYAVTHKDKGLLDLAVVSVWAVEIRDAKDHARLASWAKGLVEDDDGLARRLLGDLTARKFPIDADHWPSLRHFPAVRRYQSGWFPSRLSKDLIKQRCESCSEASGGVIATELLFDEPLWVMKDAADADAHIQTYFALPAALFLIRPSLIRRVTDFPWGTISQEEMENLFRVADETVLSDFESFVSPRGVIARNNLIYGSLGEEVFQEKHGVPTRGVNDYLHMEALAREVYARLMMVEEGKDFVFQLWGSGGLLSGTRSFRKALEQLDKEAGTRLAQKLRYVVTDREVAMVERARRKADEIPELKDWVDRGILSFRTVDAMHPPEDSRHGVDMVFSTYLYDSLPQRLAMRRGGDFFDIQARRILWASDGKPVAMDREGRPVDLAIFRQYLLREDTQALAQLDPRSFHSVVMEQILEPADPETIRVMKDIGLGGPEQKGAVSPMGEGMCASVSATLPLLRPGGEIRSLDHFVSTQEHMQAEAYVLSNAVGAFYSYPNARVVEKFATERGLTCNFIPVEQWLETDLDDMLVCVAGFGALQQEAASFLFSIEGLRKYPEIVKLAKAVSGRGYNEQARRTFLDGLKKLLGPGFSIGELMDSHSSDPLKDLQLTIVHTIQTNEFRDKIIEDSVWIGPRHPNEKFMAAFRSLGFDKRLMDRLLKTRDIFNNALIMSMVKIAPEKPMAEYLKWLENKQSGTGLDVADIQMLAKSFRPANRKMIVRDIDRIARLLEAAASQGKADVSGIVFQARSLLLRVFEAQPVRPIVENRLRGLNLLGIAA